MSERSVAHATFVIERTYEAAPARVFAAWAEPAAKARWFGPPDEGSKLEHQLDFRVGGQEVNRGQAPDGGPLYTFRALYQDIVPDHRIVYTYEMHMDRTRISVSVGTVEFEPKGSGTKMLYTDQGAYLDGHDTPEQREHGTREIFDALGAELQHEPARA